METLESRPARPPARIIAPLFLGHCDLDKAPSPRQLALLHCSCKAAAAACMQQAEKIQKHPRFDSTVDGQVALYCAVPLGGRRPPCCAVDGNGVSTRSSRLPQLGDVRFGAREAQLSTAAGGRLIFFAPFPSSIISGTHRSDMQVPFVRFLALAGSTTTSRASR